jgi:hypothetical protein
LQNAKIGLAILNAKPHYSAAEMEAQFVHGRELLARVSSFRPNTSSRRHSTASLPVSAGANSSMGRWVGGVQLLAAAEVCQGSCCMHT